MAAFDSFEQFSRSISEPERHAIRDLIKVRTDELLAARSEDARMRLLQSYLEEVHSILKDLRKLHSGSRPSVAQTQKV